MPEIPYSDLKSCRYSKKKNERGVNQTNKNPKLTLLWIKYKNVEHLIWTPRKQKINKVT